MTREGREKRKGRYRREGRGGEGSPIWGVLIRQWRTGGRRDGQEEDLDKQDAEILAVPLLTLTVCFNVTSIYGLIGGYFHGIGWCV